MLTQKRKRSQYNSLYSKSLNLSSNKKIPQKPALEYRRMTQHRCKLGQILLKSFINDFIFEIKTFSVKHQLRINTDYQSQDLTLN